MIVMSFNEWREVDKKYRRKIVQECMNNILVRGLRNYDEPQVSSNNFP